MSSRRLAIKNTQDIDLEDEPLCLEEEQVEIVPLDIPSPPSRIEKHLKFPFDMKNIKPVMVTTFDSFGRYKEEVYNVSCFNSVKFECSRVCKEVAKYYPGYEYKIYAYRAKKLAKGTVINKIVFNLKKDNKKKFIHIDISLHE